MKETLNTNAQAVLNTVRDSQRHPTAAEIYEEVRGARPRIGLASVYRILHNLVKQGYIKEVYADDETARYDGCVTRHDHAICTICGALIDVPVDVALSQEALQAAAQAAGIRLRSHELRLYGQCSVCLSEQENVAHFAKDVPL